MIQTNIFSATNSVYSLCAMFIIFSIACKKPSDQSVPDISDQLTRPYCNDPIAANYNVGFPGIPDNSVCVYPYDKFLGTWDLKDSIFREDNTLYLVMDRIITFIPVSTDTNKNQMQILDWCASPIDIYCNKYGKAYIVNTLPYPDSAQVICSTDTIMGTFQLINNEDSAMKIQLVNRNNLGHFTHKSIATKR